VVGGTSTVVGWVLLRMPDDAAPSAPTPRRRRERPSQDLAAQRVDNAAAGEKILGKPCRRPCTRYSTDRSRGKQYLVPGGPLAAPGGPWPVLSSPVVLCAGQFDMRHSQVCQAHEAPGHGVRNRCEIPAEPALLTGKPRSRLGIYNDLVSQVTQGEPGATLLSKGRDRILQTTGTVASETAHVFTVSSQVRVTLFSSGKTSGTSAQLSTSLHTS